MIFDWDFFKTFIASRVPRRTFFCAMMALIEDQPRLEDELKQYAVCWFKWSAAKFNWFAASIDHPSQPGRCDRRVARNVFNRVMTLEIPHFRLSGIRWDAFRKVFRVYHTRTQDFNGLEYRQMINCNYPGTFGPEELGSVTHIFWTTWVTLTVVDGRLIVECVNAPPVQYEEFADVRNNYDFGFGEPLLPPGYSGRVPRKGVAWVCE